MLSSAEARRYEFLFVRLRMGMVYSTPMVMYSSRQAAAELGISDRNVRRKADLHGIGRMIGSVWAFTAADIARLGRLPTTGGRPPRARRRRRSPPRARSGRQAA